MGGAEVVDEHQVARLPRLADRVRVVDRVDQLDDVLPDLLAVPEAGVERQPVLAVEVEQVLAHLGIHRPLAEERDLVEPAAPARHRVAHHGAAALPGAQSAVRLPFELDCVGAAVALHGVTVVGAERLSDRRADLVVVVAGEQPPVSLEPFDEVGGQIVEHRRANRPPRSPRPRRAR